MNQRAKSSIPYLIAFLSISAFIFTGFGIAQSEELSPIEQLGEFLYFDEDLSEPSGQSCASCHLPDVGFDDPDHNLPVSEGVIPGLFGGRNSPSSAYAMYAPIRDFDEVEGLWIGGQFWDSRATGDVLGDPLADQALGPFLNPVEMANPNKTTVVRDALDSEYGDLFVKECGEVDLTIEAQVNEAYDCIALSIAAFERTELFAPFSSKYDAYLKACLAAGGDKIDCAQGVGLKAKVVGRKIFSRLEWKGFQLFMGENDNDGVLAPGEGAMCVACHVADWTSVPEDPNPKVVVPAWSPDGTVPPMFTDFTYDNLGVPKSRHRLLRKNPVDLGLGPVVAEIVGDEKAEKENGKFKVMPLRNIGKTKPYTHNGFFHSLWGITHFYNTRDVKKWPAPEVPETVNTDELGNLGLGFRDEIAIVMFMRTLSDGYIR